MPDPAIAVWAEYGRRENVLKKGGCQVTDYLAFIMKKLFKSNVNSLYSFVVYEFSIRDEFDKRMLCKLSFGE